MKWLLAALAIVLAYWLWRCPSSLPPPAEQIAVPSQPAPATNAPRTNIEPTPPRYDAAFDQLNAPEQDIYADLRLLHGVFTRYQLFVKDPSGNPRGTHPEIVRALQGHNRARLVFLPVQHPALNPNGELCDRWGTPFFFHALARDRMEIRSAGPDRQMWTADDVCYPPPRDAQARAQQRGL